MAVFVATVIHLIAWWLLFWNQQFDLAKYLHPAFDITAKVPLSADDLIERLW